MVNTFLKNKDTRTLKQHLLPGDGSGLRVGVVNAFLEGLSQNGHMSGVVRKHGEHDTVKIKS